MVTEDLVNLMEDDVSAKEAIDVKEKKKYPDVNLTRWKERRRSKCDKRKKEKCFRCLMWQHKALGLTGSI